jgi:hypothetical protein
MHFETDSLFVNDTWRLGDKWAVNLGLRYDDNNTSNGSGEIISDDSKLSPRFGASYDLHANGKLVLNASYAQYASSINTGANIGGVTGSAGALGDWTWLYSGPPINGDPNAPTDQLVTSDEAIEIIYNWFQSIGGTSNQSELINLNIPGLGTQVRDAITTPSSEEVTVGFIKRLGSRGMVRADYIRREFDDFYARQRDLSTGQVTNPNGSMSDLVLITNENKVPNRIVQAERNYDGLHTQFAYRLASWVNIAGTWSWSHARGNFEGESEGNAALAWGGTEYPEYKDFENGFSYGDLTVDQRHRANLWAIFTPFRTDHQTLSASVLYRYGTGTPFLAARTGNAAGGAVASRNFLANPGYVTPPPTVDYWFWNRGDFLTDDFFKFGKQGFEVFVQPEILNVFNEDAVLFPNNTVFSATNNSSFQTFNPYTTTPVEGVHYGLGPAFGQANTAADYQRPREFRFSVGFRF